jgi:2-methylisocitrate lyase-like PEP mutase family enzyme
MDKLSLFKDMHFQSELLFLPNAWDVVSAMVLEQAGFKAIGTTSYGVARAMGYEDGQRIEFDDLLGLVKKMISIIEIPITVDMEAGYSNNITTVSDNVIKIADLGVSGINIEDSLKNGEPKLNDISKQCALFETIRNRLDSNGYGDFFINARIDTYLQNETPFDETIKRANAYVSSGASGIFVPGLSQFDEIEEMVKAIKAPLNIMSLPSLTECDNVNKIGVKRFSLGYSLSDATISFIEKMANELYAKQDTKDLYTDHRISTSFH